MTWRNSFYKMVCNAPAAGFCFSILIISRCDILLVFLPHVLWLRKLTAILYHSTNNRSRMFIFYLIIYFQSNQSDNWMVLQLQCLVWWYFLLFLFSLPCSNHLHFLVSDLLLLLLFMLLLMFLYYSYFCLRSSVVVLVTVPPHIIIKQ